MERAAIETILGTGTTGALIVIIGIYSWKIIDKFFIQRFEELEDKLEARDKERADESRRREDMLLKTIDKYERSQERNQKIILEQAKNFEVLKEVVNKVEDLKDTVIKHIGKE